MIILTYIGMASDSSAAGFTTHTALANAMNDPDSRVLNVQLACSFGSAMNADFVWTNVTETHAPEQVLWFPARTISFDNCVNNRRTVGFSRVGTDQDGFTINQGYQIHPPVHWLTQRMLSLHKQKFNILGFEITSFPLPDFGSWLSFFVQLFSLSFVNLPEGWGALKYALLILFIPMAIKIGTLIFNRVSF